MKKDIVKILFFIRMVLWAVALFATIYWIKWSFKLYEMGFVDETDYAAHFRPIFAKGLFLSLGAICISFLLRSVSDKIKKKNKSEISDK